MGMRCLQRARMMMRSILTGTSLPTRITQCAVAAVFASVATVPTLSAQPRAANATASVGAVTAPLRILWIGNSYTYVNDLPRTLTTLAMAAGEDRVPAITAVLKGGHDQGLVHDIHERVVQIYEACNFQDLTGQRVAKVAATLKFIEDHVARLMEIWHGLEQFQPVVFEEIDGDRKFLNGPKLAADSGHSSQDDIDSMFVVK